MRTIYNVFYTLCFIGILSLMLLTLASCDGGSESSASNNTTNGTGGSLARFTTVDNYLYTVDNTTLRLFDLQEGKAKLLKVIPIGFNIETIFARGSVLFLGASDGVHIYNIEKRESPVFLSLYRHIFSCDPVVADERFAYATLSTSRVACSRGVNVMDIIDISNLRNPVKVATRAMIDPRGLGLSGDRLIVCNSGVELYDVSDRAKPLLLHRFTNLLPNDVIPFGKSFIALLPNGLANFDFSDDKIQLVGSLNY